MSRAPPLTCGPVPALVPVDLAGDGVLAVLPPLLAVLQAQRHMQDPFLTPAAVRLRGYPSSSQFTPGTSQPSSRWVKVEGTLWGEAGVCTHRLDPGSQVGGALVETRVLDEVPFALLRHDPTVVPVEVVQVGLVLVGLHAGVGGAAGVILPGSTLCRDSRGSAGTCRCFPGHGVRGAGGETGGGGGRHARLSTGGSCGEVAAGDGDHGGADGTPPPAPSRSGPVIPHRVTPVGAGVAGEDPTCPWSCPSGPGAVLWCLASMQTLSSESRTVAAVAGTGQARRARRASSTQAATIILPVATEG